ncbi:hypothetical protein ACHAPU_011360 [Fusarium lateritium]
MGTRLALTALYSILEEKAASHFDTQGFQPIAPIERDLKLKQVLYEWSDGKGGYPPHLRTLPPDQEAGKGKVGQIFNQKEQNLVMYIASLVSFIIPKQLCSTDGPFVGPTIADIEKWNKDNLPGSASQGDGQQNGDGPYKSQSADIIKDQIKAYAAEAEKQGLGKITALLQDGKDILIQYYSYFWEATGLKDNNEFRNIINDGTSTTYRYTGTSVVIF